MHWSPVSCTPVKSLKYLADRFSNRSLAHCELYTLLSLMTVRVFPRMKLYETTESDVIYDHDIFNPLPVKTSKGVRAIIV